MDTQSLQNSKAVSHQDNDDFVANLPRLTQLNIECDHHAKAWLRDLVRSPTATQAPSLLKGEGWRCTVNGRKFTGGGPDFFEDLLSRTVMREWLAHKKQLASDHFDSVDWEAVGEAVDGFPTLFQLFVAKWVSGHCGVGKWMKRWQFWDDDTCPCCKASQESVGHLLRCDGP